MRDDGPLADLARREAALHATVSRLRARRHRGSSLGMGDATALALRTARRRDARMALLAGGIVLIALLVRRRRSSAGRPPSGSAANRREHGFP